MSQWPISVVFCANLVLQSAGFRVPRHREHEVSASGSHSHLTLDWEKFEGSGPLGRIPAAAVACEGRIFVFGGETDFSSPAEPYTVNRYLGDLWMFTPAPGGKGFEGNWTELSKDGAGPVARVSGSLVCAKDVLTLFGGIERIAPGVHEPLGDVWSFNLAKKRWSKIQADSAAAGGPGPTSAHTATLTDLDQDSMIVFGGHSPEAGRRNQVWIYSLSRQTWTLRNPASPPTARNFHTAVPVPGSASIKIWGGNTDPQVWEYDLRADTWKSAGPSPEYASGRMGTYLDGEVLSFGGFKLDGADIEYTNEVVWLTPYKFWARASVAALPPAGRCYAAVFNMDGYLWVFGGYRRPAATERLGDIWRASLQWL